MPTIFIQIQGYEKDLKEFLKCNPMEEVYAKGNFNPIVEINEKKFFTENVTSTYGPSGRYLCLEMHEVKEYVEDHGMAKNK